MKYIKHTKIEQVVYVSTGTLFVNATDVQELKKCLWLNVQLKAFV